MKRLAFTIGGGILAILIIVAAICGISYQKVKLEEGKICEGVYVDSIALGGMTADEAKQAISDYVTSLTNRTVKVNVKGNEVQTTLHELGFTSKDNQYVENAMKVGRTGNALSNYKEIKKAKSEKIVYELSYQLDDEKVKTFVDKQCSKYTKVAKNAGIKRENGVFIYTDSSPGQRVDANATMEALKKAILASGTEGDIQIDAVIIEDQPTVNKETASLCKDKLGTFSTNYSSGALDRSKNLANAARLIDGSVIYPGETFSVYKAIAPLEESNGYYAAPSYNNGEVVDSIGGGVCQVSTTLYNAVLRAEQEIVERYPHSMKVSYVELSMDAAIAGTYKDFKFKNITDAPLYISGIASNGTITFSVYGHETRSADREIRFESETTSTKEPGKDKVTYDETKPESYMAVTQQAHTGYTAKLWKIVKENGEETKTQINSSTYYPSPRYVVKGKKKADDKDKDKDKDKNKDTKNNNKNSNNNNKNNNKVSPTPEPTQAPVVTPEPQVVPQDPVQ
ncbi:MAG: VanW family protein [Lachnospiraceae bacterium]|nr:VanW family protein [Lachnospiraceae bacterium]